MTVVYDYTATNTHPALWRIFKRHEEELALFALFCQTKNIPCWRIGYEHKHGDNLEEYFKVRNSKDFLKRYGPDFKIFLNGQFYLIDVKYSQYWLPALALTLNDAREYPVYYVLARKYALSASEILNNKSKYLDQLRVFDKKEEPEEHINHLKNIFFVPPSKKDDGVQFARFDCDIGVVGEDYISGDTCVHIRWGSLVPHPLSSFIR